MIFRRRTRGKTPCGKTIGRDGRAEGGIYCMASPDGVAAMAQALRDSTEAAWCFGEGGECIDVDKLGAELALASGLKLGKMPLILG